MNQKEINELRRRFRPEKSAISRVYGCYVNSSKEIVSDLDESLGMMPQEESEKYLSLLKKGLSGSLGKNLIDTQSRRTSTAPRYTDRCGLDRIGGGNAGSTGNPHPPACSRSG